jgi:type I restriction enzyme S subunit
MKSQMIDQDITLPKNWQTVLIKDICTLINGRGFKKSEWSKLGLPIIRIQNLNSPNANFNYYEGHFDDRILISEGDLLFAWSGTPGTSFGAHIWRGKQGLLNQHIFRVVLDENNLDKNYLCLAINEKLESFISRAQGGVGLRHITKSKFENTEIYLPPLNEQRRIVAKIEALQERSRRAREALEAIPPLLEKFRQSVLATAFRGDLTAEWRQKHSDVEPASQLLERIQDERRRRWEEAELAKMKAKGKEPKDDRWKAKYKEPEPVDASGLPELPEGWEWATCEEICSKVQDGTHFSPKNQFKERIEGSYPYITAKNIKDQGIILDDITYIDHETHRNIYERCNVEKGDVLLIKDGVTTGVVTVNQIDEEFSLLSSVAMLKPEEYGVNSHYLKYYLSSPFGYSMVTGQMTGTAIKRIILDRIRRTPIPLPSFDEQRKIVEKIEKRLSIVTNVYPHVTLSLEEIERLNQSILAKAFRGELVPQDPRTEAPG